MITAIVDGEKNDNLTFPRLMRGRNGNTVLMIDAGVGVELSGNNSYYSNGWMMENFRDFDGSVTLSNDEPQ